MTLETAAASTSAGSLLGRVIDGRYRLEEELGGGAAGSTHRARRAEDSRLVVLKLFDEDVSGDAVRRSRFEWEAATLAGLAHPNVVPILDYGVFAGRRYLVSEWLDGESLAQRMRRAQLPLTAAVGIIRQILAALASVHSARLAHRNLKPTDVYLEWRKQGRERVKLLDFAPVMRPRVVATGRGSYVPPELATGEPLDARSDVYAVGALLSGMLHGGPPDAPVLAGPAATGARRGPVVDSTLQGWIRRAMARDRQERFTDAAEMLQQLIDLLPRDLRSPPEGNEASRVSSVAIPSPVRSDTRRNEPLRPDSSRSQTMRSESFATASTSELRDEEPLRVEMEPVARANPHSSKGKDSVTAESREAFARSERARAFIEARGKGRTRSATRAGELDPAHVTAEAALPPSSAATDVTSAGWVIAEPARPAPQVESAAAAPVEASGVDSQTEAVRSDPQIGEMLEELAPRPVTRVEAADPLAHARSRQRTESEDLAEAGAAEPAASAPGAGESIAYDVDRSNSFEPARTLVTRFIEQPCEASGRSASKVELSAESAPPAARFLSDATGSTTLESVKPQAAAARSRGWPPSNRPPNRKARREAARLAALQQHIPSPRSVDAPKNAEAARSLAPVDGESTPARSRTAARARPRSTDQGSVRDAVVGSAALWFSRLARHVRFSPSVGHGSLIALGVMCVIAVAVVSLSSLDLRDSSGPGTVQTAVDSTSSPLAVAHASAAGARPGTPETTVDRATVPADATHGTDDTAVESGLSDRPPAVNPWKDDLLPPELEGIPALANKGDPGDEPTVRRLREYSRFNENDARGLLLLGRLYVNRYWRTDALTQFQLAVERDPSARGAPEIMAALLDLIVIGKAAEPAEAFILRVYGREALPAIEAELEKLQRPMSIQRLSAVRAKLLDR